MSIESTASTQFATAAKAPAAAALVPASRVPAPSATTASASTHRRDTAKASRVHHGHHKTIHRTAAAHEPHEKARSSGLSDAMSTLSEEMGSKINTAFNSAWTAQIQQQQSMEAQFRSIQKAMSDKFDVLSKRVIELESQKRTRNECAIDNGTVQMITDDLQCKTSQIGELYENLVHNRDYSENSRRQIDQLQETIASKKDEITSLKEQIATQDHMTQDLSAKLHVVNNQITMVRENYREVAVRVGETEEELVYNIDVLEKKVNANTIRVNKLTPRISAAKIPDVEGLGDKVAACHTDIAAMKLAMETLSSKYEETDTMVKVHDGEIDDLLELIHETSHAVDDLNYQNKKKDKANLKVKTAIDGIRQNSVYVVQVLGNLLDKSDEQKLKLSSVQEELMSQNTKIDQRMSVHEDRLEALIQSVGNLGDLVGDLYDQSNPNGPSDPNDPSDPSDPSDLNDQIDPNDHPDHTDHGEKGSVNELAQEESAGSLPSCRSEESLESIELPEEPRSLDNNNVMISETPVVEDNGFKRVKSKVKDFLLVKVRGYEKIDLINDSRGEFPPIPTGEIYSK